MLDIDIRALKNSPHILRGLFFMCFSTESWILSSNQVRTGILHKDRNWQQVLSKSNSHLRKNETALVLPAELGTLSPANIYNFIPELGSIARSSWCFNCIFLHTTPLIPRFWILTLPWCALDSMLEPILHSRNQRLDRFKIEAETQTNFPLPRIYSSIGIFPPDLSTSSTPELYKVLYKVFGASELTIP